LPVITNKFQTLPVPGAVKGKTGSKGEPLLDPTPTLKELGIDKKTSMVAQQLAAMPEETLIGRSCFFPP